MGSIRTLELKLVDQLFEADPGWPLDLTNNTLASFFAQELGVQIYDDRYNGRGTSKMNRLRRYLEVAEDKEAAAALVALWEYRQTLDKPPREVVNADARFAALVTRLGGTPPVNTAPPAAPSPPKTPAPVSPVELARLSEALMALSTISSVPRGLAFERFLRDLFTVHGLATRGSISIRGEQIDGSFDLDGQTYLIEAKWQNAPTGAGDLHTFEGKLGQKATWTRGVFISQAGFTAEGLHAFGRGKRLICMDGLDLWDTLNGTLPFDETIRRKVVRASQTGEIFTRVRDLI